MKQWQIIGIGLWCLSGGTLLRAATLLTTDFNGRTVSGTTASNLNWTTSGLSDPGDLSAADVLPDTASGDPNLFTTSAAANRFGVDRNMHNEGFWFVNVALTPSTADNVEIDFVEVDAFIFNNAGSLQSVERALTITAEILDESLVVLDSVALDIYTSNGSGAPTPAQGTTAQFDFTTDPLYPRDRPIPSNSPSVGSAPEIIRVSITSSWTVP